MTQVVLCNSEIHKIKAIFLKISIDIRMMMWYDIDAIKEERKRKTPKGGESSEQGRRVAADVRKITRGSREAEWRLSSTRSSRDI